ncbi:MAG: LysM peptidoglycan-binding domain-containing protein [Chloroflexota bacterium]
MRNHVQRVQRIPSRSLRTAFTTGAMLMAAVLASTALLVRPVEVNAQEQCGATYTVSPGDTLYSLAQQCGTTVDAIVSANPSITNPDMIAAGSELALPTTASAGPDQNEMDTYRIQPGDTLYSIAQQHDTSVPALLESNPQIENPNTILVGQDLQIPGSVAAEPPVFSRIEIPLIAPESGNLGCGDQLVFVERTVEPTQAPLAAAFDSLLTMDERSLGQSGLYNPIYQSNLRVDDLQLENRTASIHLAGDLRLGGVCDAPRVAAQLRQTALQFNTVDDVQVFINGQPLDQALSAQ